MQVRNATPDDRDGVIATFTRAFAHDAIVRFLFANDGTWPDRAARFFGHYFDVRLAGGEISVCEDDGILGAALWNPPGGNRRGPAFVREHWERSVVAAIDPDEVARYEAFTRVLEAMTPEEPHWYLGLLGTEPSRHGTGVARALLEPMLVRADDDGLPAFLETGMPGNVAIYDRFGFATIAESDVADGPHIWGMLRRPH